MTSRILLRAKRALREHCEHRKREACIASLASALALSSVRSGFRSLRSRLQTNWRRRCDPRRICAVERKLCTASSAIIEPQQLVAELCTASTADRRPLANRAIGDADLQAVDDLRWMRCRATGRSVAGLQSPQARCRVSTRICLHREGRTAGTAAHANASEASENLIVASRVRVKRGCNSREGFPSMLASRTNKFLHHLITRFLCANAHS